MKFRLVEDNFNDPYKIQLEETLLIEKTEYEHEIGKHLFGDISNSYALDLAGLRTRVLKIYSTKIFNLCRKLTKSSADAIKLFKDIEQGSWEVHHINGIHNDNKIKGYENNLALVRDSIHARITEENYDFIYTECLKVLPKFMEIQDSDIEKLVLRLLAIMKVKNMDYRKLFKFEVEGFQEFLTIQLPRKVANNFYNKYKYSSTDVIRLIDL